MGLPGRGKAKQAGSGASMNTAHTRGKSQNRAPSANSTLGPALEHDIRAAIVGPAALSWALPTREDQLTSGLASERHESDHGAGARVGSSAWIALIRQSFGGLPGCGKLRVRRVRRGCLARRRGFRSGFSRLPADPTEPDDGQSWHPRRNDHHSSNLLPVLVSARRQSGDHTPDLSPPEATLPADCPKRWQRPRVRPASDGAWRHREQLGDERGGEYVGVVVVGLEYERGQRSALSLPSQPLPAGFLRTRSVARRCRKA